MGSIYASLKKKDLKVMLCAEVDRALWGNKSCSTRTLVQHEPVKTKKGCTDMRMKRYGKH